MTVKEGVMKKTQIFNGTLDLIANIAVAVTVAITMTAL